jgi:pyridoxine 5-phosphate synthase
VNIDHVATVRQARRGRVPDLLSAARACEKAGAGAITVHLREDRRHIQDEDVRLLRRKIRVRLNLEMAVAPEIVSFACRVRPHEVCLVPEKRQELTTEGGLDVAGQKARIARAVRRLKKAGIQVSLFVDPAPRQIRAAKDAGADCVELHTGSYADARTGLRRKSEFRKLVAAGRLARELGLVLNAGHGLDCGNAGPVARIRGMHELNIGFSIVARALFTGLEKAVREMKRVIS